jgi:hypothetical protein
MFNDNRRLIAGAVIWLIVLIGLRPSLMEPLWAVILLLLAALLLVPLALLLIESTDIAKMVTFLQFPAAVSLTAAFLLPDGWPASLLALPWLAVTAVLALAGLRRLQKRGLKPWAALAVDAGLIYLPVGAIWALLARMGVRPLGFSDDIVMLTAVHFHYAGFLLPVLCGLAAERKAGRTATAAVLGVVIGVPLTAVGITLSQVGVGAGVETGSAWITAAAGLLTAGLYVRLAADARYKTAGRVLWTVTAVSLTTGMFLAALYGSRQLLPLEWLTIPWMRALHGTVNSLGFALSALLAWKIQQSTANPKN